MHSSAGKPTNVHILVPCPAAALQLTVLVFVRSIRSGNFPLYIQSLTKLVHWFFTFDHYHGTRDSRDIVEKFVIDNLYRIEALGCQQYDNFVSERLVERTITIYDVMKKNNVHLFNTPHKRQKTKTIILHSRPSDDVFPFAGACLCPLCHCG